MKTLLTFLFISVFGLHQGFAQLKKKIFPNNDINLKVSVFHSPENYPALGLEYQRKGKRAIQVDFYAADVLFNTRNAFVGMAVTFRRYYNIRKRLNGLYYQVGIDNSLNLNQYKATQNVNFKQNFGIGPKVGIGYQKRYKKDWVIDVGICYSYFLNTESKHRGFYIGFGRKLR